MSDYRTRLHDLFQLEFFGMKLGLENIHALLDSLGRPDRRFATIHVAGTNGKGSVSAMLASVFQTDGRRVGLYTSPHLVDFRERIRVNGVMIPEEAVARWLDKMWPTVEELRATFFEVTTAMAFAHFAEAAIDIAIIETGLGGRLDATNVLERPLATVVTSIGHDHMAQLGNTLPEIASEKAGIMKPGVPAVVNCTQEVAHVFSETARRVGAPLHFVDVAAPLTIAQLEPPLPGEHQQENLRTVIATLAVLPERPSDDVIRKGIRETTERAGLRARLERYRTDELDRNGITMLLDVGHNPEALREVSRYFTERGVRPIVVFGIMRDKDVHATLRALGGFADEIIAVEASTARALPSAELHAAALALGLRSRDGGKVRDGVELALRESQAQATGATILVGGSHYVVGDFLAGQGEGKASS